jgi:hypothetical protein
MTDALNHATSQERNLVSLYVMGKLSPQEEAEFEEHLAECPQCLDEVELTEDFRAALQRVALEDAVRSRVLKRRGAFARLAAMGDWERAALLAVAMLLLLGGPGAFFVSKIRRRDAELAQVKMALEDSQRKYNQAKQASAESARPPQEDGYQEPGVAQAENPEGVAPLFALTITRSTDLGTSEPPGIIVIPRVSRSIVLSLELEPDPGLRNYHAQLQDSQGRVVWIAKSFLAPPTDALAITLPSRLFRAGDYVLILEGTSRSGSSVPVARYKFRAAFQ